MTAAQRRPSLSRTLAYRLAMVSVVLMAVLGGLWAVKEYRNFSREVERARLIFESQQKALVKGIVSTALRFVDLQRNDVEQQARQTIKARVDRGVAIIDHLIKIYSDSLDQAELRKLAMESLSPVRFDNGNGYYFVVDLSSDPPVMIDGPEAEAGNLPEDRLAQTRHIVETMVKIAASAEGGFYTYRWIKPGAPGTDHRKLTYVRKIASLGLIIGSGVYYDDLEKETKQQVLNRIREIRYGKNGYVFAATWDGLSLTGPAKGRNVLNAEDVNGVKVVQELIKKAKSGGGFLEYHIPAETGYKPARKISYVAGIPAWRWYVGAGFDLASIERHMSEIRTDHLNDLLSILLVVILTVAILISLIVFTARRESAKVHQIYEEFAKFFEDASRSMTTIDAENMRYAEFRKIALAANEMVATRSAIEENLRESEINLIIAKTEAENAAKAKSAFLANMSHELRTPLNAITGFSEMIESETLGEIINKRYIEYARHIRMSGDHLLSIINDVLDLSKIEAGKLEIEPTAFSLQSMIDETAALVRIRSERPADRFVVDIAEDASEVYADIRSFRQVLLNLLTNAVKYSSADSRIYIRCRRGADDGTIIEVEDEGVGIAEQDIETVLQPFGQVRANAQVAHEGTGLGLSLSNELMGLHGGTLTLSSELGRGTTVRLGFPPAPGSSSS